METLTIQLTDAAYLTYRLAIQQHPELDARGLSVQEWIQEHLNMHVDEMVEMMLQNK